MTYLCEGPSRGQASRWPAWFAAVGLMMALGGSLTLGGAMSATITALAGADASDPPVGATLAAVALQDALFVLTVLFLASRAGPVCPAALGFRPAPLQLVAAVTALSGLAFLVFSAMYSAIVGTDAQQDTLENLGADQGTALLVLSGILVVAVAPFVEELLFRGFAYRCLRNRFSVALSSAVIGAVFGAIHFDGADTLELLPVLAVLGAIFCVAYERAGTLYAPIALHAINNAVAFAVTGPSPAPIIAVVLLLAVLTACAMRLRQPRPEEARPVPSGSHAR